MSGWQWPVGLTTMALGLALAVGAASTAGAQGAVLVDETFAGSAVLDPSFSVQGGTCLTGRDPGVAPPPGAASIPVCLTQDEGPVPAPGVLPGYLQLTDAGNDEAGSILYNRPVPSSAGLVAAFDQWQYGGTGADGIAFFLADGATTLSQPGAFGGSLGYAQRDLINGIAGAYVGVGLDAFGSFYNDNGGRGKGCPAGQTAPFPGRTVPGSVTLRGPGNLQAGYCFLGSTATAVDPPTSTLPGALRGTSLATARRRVVVTVTPGPAPRVLVAIDFFDGAGPQQVLDVPAPPNPPATYKFGWTASTGSSTDVHLIRNVEVRTVNPLQQLTLTKQVDTLALPNPLVLGSVVPYQFVVTNTGSETLTDLAVSDPRVPGVVCPRTTIDPAPAETSTAVCTGSYTVTQADVDAGQIVNTATAAATAPGGGVVESNSSTVTLAVGSAPRLTLAKGVLSPPPYRLGETITYRYDVTNTGSISVDLGASGAVTDDKVHDVGCAEPLTLLPQPQFPSSTTCTGTYVLTASDVDAAGSLTNTATVTGRPAGGDGTVTSAEVSLTLPVGADLGVTKTADLPSPALGELVTFTVAITNAGPSPAIAVGVQDVLPAGLALVSATPSRGLYDAAAGVWRIGGLPVGGAATLRLTARTTVAGTFTNTATVSASTFDPDPANDTASAAVVVPPPSTIPSSTTTTSTTSTTTSTTVPGEVCGNCVDDDGDGAIDAADPDCCEQLGTLVVTRVRAKPRGRGRARLRVDGTLAGAGFATLDPRREAVAVTLGDDMPLACCTIPEQKWMKLYRRHFGFWDQHARVCPPLVDVGLSQTRTGGAFSIVASRIAIDQLQGPALRVTLRVGESCASGSAPLRRTRSGSLVFP